MSSFFGDLRQALVALARARGFTLGAILCLALGLGAGLAVLAQVDQLVLRPLALPRPDRLVALKATDLRTKQAGPLSISQVLGLQEGASDLLETVACTSRNRTLVGLEEPLQVKVGLVTWNFFSCLGAKPAAGRLTFSKAEGVADPAGVAVISHAFWRERFGTDPGVIGRRVRLNGHGTEIVGVLPADFRFPLRVSDCAVFLPEAVPFASHWSPGMQTYSMAGRLRDGATPSQAQNRLAAAAAGLGQGGISISLDPLGEAVSGPTSRVLYPLSAAVGLLVLIAIFNVASLQLARNLAREREFAVRRALGASLGKLWSQFLAESLLLAFCAALMGLVLSLGLQLGLQQLAIVPVQVQLNGRLTGAAVLLALLTGFGLALFSALLQKRKETHQALRQGAGGTAPRRHRVALKAMVACELALSVAILLGTGRLVRTLVNLQQVDPGFAAPHVLTGRIPLPPAKYGKQEAQNAFLDALVPRLRGIPGVHEVGINDTMTFINASNGTFASTAPDPSARQSHTFFHVVTPEYFATLEIPMLQGRAFRASEKDTCVISQRLAERLWPGEHAVGRLIYGADKPLTVIGVVGEIRESDLQEAGDPQMYVSAYDFSLFEGAVVALRVQGDPKAYIGTVKRAIREVDPALAIPVIQPLQEAIRKSYAIPRTASLMFGGFGALALALTGFGLFSVLSQSVARRTREFGIRSALGAGPVRLVGEVTKEAGLILSLGLAGGAGLGWLLGRPLEAILFRAGHADAALYACVLGTLGTVAFLSLLLPALRAFFLRPSLALRAE